MKRNIYEGTINPGNPTSLNTFNFNSSTEVIETFYNNKLSICINIYKIKLLRWKRRTKYKSMKRNKEREIWEKLWKKLNWDDHENKHISQMWVELQENLITDLWQNNLWLFGVVEGKESKRFLICSLCWRILFYAAKNQYVVIYSNDPVQRALEKH